MFKILSSYKSALGDLFSPRIFLFCISIPFLAIILIVGFDLLIGPIFNRWLGELLFSFKVPWDGWPQMPVISERYQMLFASLFLILLSIPLFFALILILTGIFMVPRIQNYLLGSRFADLQRLNGGSIHGAVWNSLKYGGIYFILFLLTIPLWLIPGMALLVPAVLNMWLSEKVMPYDLLQGVASDHERHELRRFHRGALRGLGFGIGLLSAIPFISLFVPAFAALAFGDFCYRRLRELRSGG